MAARRTGVLDLWMNGEHVGQWQRGGASTDRLTYTAEWMHSPLGRPLSLSLPFTTSGVVDSPKVNAYFENLIPDNEQILRRLQERYRTRSTNAFDLLAELGRDCAGAIQLVPKGENPGDIKAIAAEPLSTAQIAQHLRDVTISRPLGRDATGDHRLSIAGAQEKTALLYHRGRWCKPKDATPSTHLFKLPMGRVGEMQADLGKSVELEWLTMELLREFGMPVAKVEIGHFEDQTALIVERFDRRLDHTRRWWWRIPQEDFCQVLGVPPSRKYEAEGGPGIKAILEVLRGSSNAVVDRQTFFKSQVLYWVLAATDGHAKNFSLVIEAGGNYHLAPLYDVISIYPFLGHGTSKLSPQDATLAMAVLGKNRHYKLKEIQRRHWDETARMVGLEGGCDPIVEQIVDTTPVAIERVGKRLPPDFPDLLFDEVTTGLSRAVERLSTQ